MKFLLFIYLIRLIQVQSIISSNRCPNLNPVTDFNAEKFSGVWYEIERFSNTFEENRKCIKSNFTLLENGAAFNISIEGIDSVNNKMNSMFAIAKFEENPNTGKFYVQLVSNTGTLPIKPTFWILATDYETYAIGWTCSWIILQSVSVAWVFGREKIMAQNDIDRIHKIFDKLGLESGNFEKMDQTNCPN